MKRVFIKLVRIYTVASNIFSDVTFEDVTILRRKTAGSVVRFSVISGINILFSIFLILWWIPCTDGHNVFVSQVQEPVKDISSAMVTGDVTNFCTAIFVTDD